MGSVSAMVAPSIEAPPMRPAPADDRTSSTGSLYLCAVGLLPLGLPPADDFWSTPPQPWTSVRAWSGQPFPIDRAMRDIGDG